MMVVKTSQPLKKRLERVLGKTAQDRWNSKRYLDCRDSIRTRNKARKRQGKFLLKLPESMSFRRYFWEHIHDNCEYCGRPPLIIEFEGELVSEGHGYDRINNDVNYFIPNMATACDICNYMKRNLSVEEFKAWLAAVHALLGIPKPLYALTAYDPEVDLKIFKRKYRAERISKEEIESQLSSPRQDAKAYAMANDVEVGQRRGSLDVLDALGWQEVGVYKTKPDYKPRPVKRRAYTGTRGTPQTAEMFWLRCECGKEFAKRRCELEGGKDEKKKIVLSCGGENCRLPQVSAIGLRIGMLSAVTDLGTRKGDRMYRCKCHYCDGETEMRMNDFISQKMVSCGCVTKHQDSGMAVLSSMFSRLKHDAKYNRECLQHLPEDKRCTLTFGQYVAVVTKNCQWCGADPVERFWHRTKGSEMTNGIDRIYNPRGYEPETSWASCIHCNLARNDLTVEEFEEAVRRAHAHMQQPGWKLRIQTV